MNNTATAENDSPFVPSLNHERKLELPEKKEHYLEPLLHALDGLIYLYFAALYMCDNLSLLLILRLANQIVHVRAPISQLPPTILVSVVCLVTHLLQSRPGDKRLYGGILIDFVGELAPSTARLLLLDILVFALQLIMLVAGHEKQKSSGEAQSPETPQPQDLESEEAGRLRSRTQDNGAETDEGVEMRSLLPDGSEEQERAHQKRSDPGGQDDEVILLDLTGLRALMRRPPPTSSPATSEDPAARASLATFLANLAARRARGA
ncbi:hypothetical protein A1O7_07027 [Cladophialophora yegresii CBS 114405]|uniref:DUF1746 domain-containing protein n=1 Tax=Cladophialophora yegresii CBS 114405 TaxID=1182544 RepID=W9VMC9_9EURO|nr:uncharacterized protein A1O7_07027 [Cladophialophora yegresii CBS 114405]EXJ56683.1 hypothetical protein A1O7_07027 [Cladophialophora yegresii CBS 114405]